MKYQWKKIILSLFLVILGAFLLVILMQSSALACDLELDYGIAWIDDMTYYMPVEAVEINDSSADFRGSNGIVYSVNFDNFSALDGVKIDDFQWLATMDSRGSHYWWDDEILVLWRC